MTLDDAIRAAVRDGCTGITLWPAAHVWQAGIRGSGDGWRVGIDADPVVALRKALQAEEPQPDDGVFG